MDKNKKLIEIADLSPEEFRRWQLKLLDILIYFRDFCIEHNLKFFISAGTCLGAVRHKGFIPWDDDVDVCMPRKDYDKLLKIWNEYADLSKFKCCHTTKDQPIGFPMAVIRSEDTTCIYEHSKNWDICQGLKIDVEHLDGMPKEKYKQIIQYICAKALAIFRAQRLPNQKSIFVRKCSKLFLTIFRSPKINYKISSFLERQVTRYDFEKSEYVRYLGCKSHKRDFFDEVIWVDFENTTMPIPKRYDEFLRTIYGDYMQLPSEEKRKPITKCVFYDLDNSYKKYKGVYYCKK